jgi:hypothetical protein
VKSRASVSTTEFVDLLRQVLGLAPIPNVLCSRNDTGRGAGSECGDSKVETEESDADVEYLRPLRAESDRRRGKQA